MVLDPHTDPHTRRRPDLAHAHRARYRRDHDGTITMLPRRIGALSTLQHATRLPDALARAMTDAVLARLEPALTQTSPTTSTSGAPVLQTRGPRSGRPGDYEAHPYPEEIHALGSTALLMRRSPSRRTSFSGRFFPGRLRTRRAGVWPPMAVRGRS